MAFVKKVWEDRQSEYPNRRKLTPTGITDTYSVSRDEGLVVKEGNPFNAATMNDLESRIDSHAQDTTHVTATDKDKLSKAVLVTGSTMSGTLIAGGTQDIATAQVRNVIVMHKSDPAPTNPIEGAIYIRLTT